MRPKDIKRAAWGLALGAMAVIEAVPAGATSHACVVRPMADGFCALRPGLVGWMILDFLDCFA